MGAEKLQLEDVLKDNELSLGEIKKLDQAIKSSKLPSSIEDQINKDPRLKTSAEAALNSFFREGEDKNGLSKRINTFGEISSFLNVMTAFQDKNPQHTEQLVSRFNALLDAKAKKMVDLQKANAVSPLDAATLGGFISLEEFQSLQESAKSLAIPAGDHSQVLLQVLSFSGRVLSLQGKISKDDSKMVYTGVFNETKQGQEIQQEQMIQKNQEQIQRKVEITNNSSEDIADSVFEGYTQDEFNAVFDKALSGSTTLTISETSTGAALQFYKFVQKYVGVDKKIANVRLMIDTEGTTYKSGERVVKYNLVDSASKDKDYILAWGPQSHLQDSRSESNNAKIATDIFLNGEKNDKGVVDLSKQFNFNVFDEKGTYKTFAKVLDADKDFLRKNLSVIMPKLKAYMPAEGTSDYDQYNLVKNGYADVLTNAIVSSGNEDLMKSFLSYMKPENSIYLGTDKATQVKNFNLLVSSPLYKLVEPDLSPEKKKVIMSLRLGIDRMDQKTLTQGLQEGFDSLVKAFGPMLLSIVELFGGKGALRKFCANFGINYDKYFAQFEKLYQDEYSMSEPQRIFLGKMYTTLNQESWSVGQDVMKVVGADGKLQALTYNRKNITTSYETELKKDANFLLLDPVLVEQAMKKKNIIHNDVIVSAKVGDKVVKTINPNTSLSADKRAVIITSLVNDESVWSRIESAGIAMAGDAVYNTQTQNPFENDKMKDAKNKKGINDAMDIGMYYGAYLFAGSKDLKYVVSETANMPHEKDNLKNAQAQNQEQIKLEEQKKACTDFSTNVLSDTYKDCPIVAQEGKTLSETDNKINTEYTALISKFDTYLSSAYLPLMENIQNLDKHIVNYLKTKVDSKNTADVAILDKITSITSDRILKITDGKLVFSGKTANTTPVEVSLDGFSWLSSKSS